MVRGPVARVRCIGTLALVMAMGCPMIGHAQGLRNQAQNPLFRGSEESLVMDGDQCDDWYRGFNPDGSNAGLFYTYATDTECVNWAPPVTLVGVSGLYPYVFRWIGDQQLYMAIVTGGSPPYDLYLYTTTDKINWHVAHGNVPILAHGPWILDNPAIAVVGDTWYLLQEVYRAEWGGYVTLWSWTTIAEGLDFAPHLTSTPIFPGNTGNPMLVAVPDRHALLAIYGTYMVPNGTWTLKSSVGSFLSDLSQPANWSDAGFTWGVLGVHITDPALVFADTTGKSFQVLLAYTYGQLEANHATGDMTIDQLYDIAVALNPFD